MKKVMSLLMGCSLILAGAVMAQQPDDQSHEKKKQQVHEKAQRQSAAQPRANANRNANVNAQKSQGAAMQQRRMNANAQRNPNVQKHTAAKTENAVGAETNVSNQAATTNATELKQHGEHHRKGMKAADANAERAVAPAPHAATNTATNAAAASTSTMSQQNRQANAMGGGKQKPDPQKVQQIKQQHANFRAQPKPQQVPTVTYQQNYRIQNSDRWTGQQYEVFRSYHPERHDQHWYHSHYNNVVLIGGGYYFFNAGYWFPAWGYDTAHEYYAYDAPIYVGHAAEPPDRVIADVQATLQEMGYYTGEVDGLLGPLTREALTAYQNDQGLTPTAMIDEPTLDSLGMS